MSLKLLNCHSSLGKYLDLFHDWSMVMLIFVSFLVFSVLYVFSSNSWSFNDYVEAESLEVVWTMTPGLVLLLLVAPSLYGLYLLDVTEVGVPIRSLNVIGRQWYWSYSYIPGFKSYHGGRLSYDSFMKVDSVFDIRGLDVDCPLVMGIGGLNRVLLSSKDVMHSFAVPQLGVKLDCVPGRLNQSFMESFSLGKFYGQCSEMCGANHSFMPISVECV